MEYSASVARACGGRDRVVLRSILDVEYVHERGGARGRMREVPGERVDVGWGAGMGRAGGMWDGTGQERRGEMGRHGLDWN